VSGRLDDINTEVPAGKKPSALATTNMPHSGHIIVLRQDLDQKKYEAMGLHPNNLQALKRLRDTLNFINPTNYRGTGRQHFDSAPFYVDDNGVLEKWPDSNLSEYDNLEAKKLLAAYEQANAPKDVNIDFCLFSFEEIYNVYKLIDNKADYEILEIIENEKMTTNMTIGFDVGFFGGDFYSAIADTAIKPIWNPPHFDDMKDILEHLKKINNNCLFDNFDDAKIYREIYLTKAWGDKESYPGQITIIQIRTV
jgi:hypothetical protein